MFGEVFLFGIFILGGLYLHDETDGKSCVGASFLLDMYALLRTTVYASFHCIFSAYKERYPDQERTASCRFLAFHHVFSGGFGPTQTSY